MAKERLAKCLAHAGIASRRASEEYITQGRVSVNGEVITHIPTLVDISSDRIEVDGNRLKKEATTYILLHKPKGVECTMKASKKKDTLTDCLPKKIGRLYPVGRLDKASTGLLLLTNDGDMANRLVHPRYKVVKQYRVEIKGYFESRDLTRLEKGINLEEGKTLPCRVKLLHADSKSSRLHFELKEGKNRQIRRMLGVLGYDVKKLRRDSIGPLGLSRLKAGEWRFLKGEEIEKLKKITHIK